MKKCTGDHIAPLGPAGPGGWQHVVRANASGVEVGVWREVPDGAPLVPGTEIVETDQGHVTSSYTVPGGPAHRGPAHVASDAYRTGYERIFGGAHRPMVS